MTSQHDKAKRWRPRFSARTMVVVVTLVCCYAACWGPTKDRGVGQVFHRACREIGMDFPDDVSPSHEFMQHFDASPTIPLVVGVAMPGSRHRDFYFWFFGYIAKLPLTRELPDDENISRYLEAATSIPQSLAPPHSAPTPRYVLDLTLLDRSG